MSDQPSKFVGSQPHSPSSDARPEGEGSYSVRKAQRSTPQPPLTDLTRFTGEEDLGYLIQEEAKRIPDIRQDRIAKIRTALEAGNYEVSSDDLAKAILRDTLLNAPSNQKLSEFSDLNPET